MFSCFAQLWLAQFLCQHGNQGFQWFLWKHIFHCLTLSFTSFTHKKRRKEGFPRDESGPLHFAAQSFFTCSLCRDITLLCTHAEASCCLLNTRRQPRLTFMCFNCHTLEPTALAFYSSASLWGHSVDFNGKVPSQKNWATKHVSIIHLSPTLKFVCIPGLQRSQEMTIPPGDARHNEGLPFRLPHLSLIK